MKVFLRTALWVGRGLRPALNFNRGNWTFAEVAAGRPIDSRNGGRDDHGYHKSEGGSETTPYHGTYSAA
jgi:hypothetical protein